MNLFAKFFLIVQIYHFSDGEKLRDLLVAIRNFFVVNLLVCFTACSAFVFGKRDLDKLVVVFDKRSRVHVYYWNTVLETVISELFSLI